ncbi:MAG: hypothetical protein ABSB19_13465, partial [Methylomonas sp.]
MKWVISKINVMACSIVFNFVEISEIVNLVVASTVKFYAAFLFWFVSSLSGLRWTALTLCQFR